MRFVGLIVFGYFGLSLIYFVVSAYSRSVRREKLEKQWDEDHQGGDPDARNTYIEEGMAQYEHGFRKKLIVLVYVIPVVVIVTTLILTN